MSSLISAFRTLIGVFLALVLVANTLFFGVPLLIAVLFRMLSPTRALQDIGARGVEWVASTWMKVNLAAVAIFLPIRWDIQIDADIDHNTSYMITSNHQSWVDIMALYQAFIYEIPFLRFFLKQELIWIPILGAAWWGLDFPFMKRYSKEYLAKHPEKAGQDLVTTRKSCERFQGTSVSILNFLEGTRFRESLHSKQQSPYQHLLKPKAGGLAFALSAMGDQLDCLLNVTIAYPNGVGELWAFLCGRISYIRVRVEKVPIPAEFFTGDYQNDMEFRAEFQAWVTTLWQQKDQQLNELLGNGEAN